MSYILDALRKSEHERQVAARQGIGMLYPLTVQRDRKLWIPVGIVVSGVLACILIGWLWFRLDDAPSVADKALTSAATQPVEATHKVASEAAATKKTRIPPTVPRKNSGLSLAETRRQPIEQKKVEPSAAAVAPQAQSEELIKDIPALNITGYVHDEQGGSLAMINNQLVREGEEVSPGLLLVKILDNRAIFSYKGYVFSR
jgi:general secretion pathway protein B